MYRHCPPLSTMLSHSVNRKAAIKMLNGCKKLEPLLCPAPHLLWKRNQLHELNKAMREHPPTQLETSTSHGLEKNLLCIHILELP